MNTKRTSVAADDRTDLRTDVLIGGGGFAGLALAIALRQGLGESFRVIVADPALGRDARDDGRASAIAAAARRLFETIGVWEEVAGEAQPILDMVVTDSRLQDVMRPTYLTFAGEIAPGEPFAHMVENHRWSRRSPSAQAPTASSFGRLRCEASRPAATGSTRRFPMTAWSSARLVVAADGARSAIREACGIQSFGWDYEQSGIVTTVEHERDHDGRAEEHFLPAGPFAILPLKGRRSSIVWTEEAREAERIVALPDPEFHAELERRFGLKLGEIKAVGPRRAFPLGLSVARAFRRRAGRAGRRRRARHSSDRRAGPQSRIARRRGAGGGHRRCGAARARSRRRRRARPLSALAAVRHHDDGRRDRRA